MKKASKIIFAVGVISAMTASVFADSFVNGGFESGTTNGWTLQSGTWSSSNPGTINNSWQGDSAIIDSVTGGITNKDANTKGNLAEVLQGNNSFRLNNAANGAHYSVVSQTVSNYTDANLYFGFAAVLEDPGHPQVQEPKFSFSIFDVTKGQVLYNVAFNSDDMAAQGVAYHAGTSDWLYTDWNVIHVNTSALRGDTFTITASAYDCALGGHGGYAYIDSFQPTLPDPNPGVSFTLLQADNLIQAVPEPTSIVMWSLGGLALLWGGKRRLFKPQA